MLANLSGFDGSPDSMRNLQLEYGAEIGRAIVNFDGPIVFCVISRYHGGAFVVFSKALNPRMTVLAVEGSFASVIGGAPAAAVVFAGEVDKRTAADPRVQNVQKALRSADDLERAAIAAQLREVRTAVRAEKLGEVATEFDRIHSIHRAVEVGSVDAVIKAKDLRPRIIAELEKSVSRRRGHAPGPGRVVDDVPVIKALIFGTIFFLIATFPATWLLMLFLGNMGANVSYWGALPLGILVSVVLAGVTSPRATVVQTYRS